MSCGGLDAVQLWNIHHGKLVRTFTARQRNLGFIVIDIGPCGKYLVTADNKETIRTWGIEVGFCATHAQKQTAQVHTKTFFPRRHLCRRRESDKDRDGVWGARGGDTKRDEYCNEQRRKSGLDQACCSNCLSL